MKTRLLLFLLSCSFFGSAQTKVTFVLEDLPAHQYQNVGIRGSTSPLSWYQSIPLARNGNTYSLTLDFGQNMSDLEYKFVIFDTDDQVEYERIENRVLKLKGQPVLKSNNQWSVKPAIDPSSFPKITAKRLLSDYRLIEQMVLSVHPGTYRYNSQSSILRQLQELKTYLAAPRSHAEAFLAIQKMLASLKCGNTSASLYKQNKKVSSIIHSQKDKLPFTFRWVDGRMFVTNDATSKSVLKKGTEILQINNYPVALLKEKVEKYISTDGNNKGNRLAQMEIRGYSFDYDGFDVFYPLLFPNENGSIELSIKLGKTSKTVSVTPQTRGQRNKILQTRNEGFPKTPDDLWNHAIIDENVGILQVSSFQLDKMQQNWRMILDDAFDNFVNEDVGNVIIDLRENANMSEDVVNELLKYLVKYQYNPNGLEGRTRYINMPTSLRPYISSNEKTPWYFSLNPSRTGEAYYVFNDAINTKAVKPDALKSYGGAIYLLVGPRNSANTFYFARAAQRHQLATITGQETGGNLKGINSGQTLYLNLPNSGIVINFPIWGSFATDTQPTTGVMPDYYIEPKISDLPYLIDTEVEGILNLIEKKVQNTGKVIKP